jgi:hypothetical protein
VPGERPLIGVDRKWLADRQNDANDATRTFDLIIVCVAGWDICHSTDGRGFELGTRLRMPAIARRTQTNRTSRAAA